jgi:DNA invertase Pin-like site-specific DNA recombinase
VELHNHGQPHLRRCAVNVIGYLRVSTREQGESGAGLSAQRSAISAEAVRRGWTVVWIEDRGESGKSMKRAGIADALRLLKRKECAVLVVAKLDRLSRSVHDFAGLLKLSRRQKWGVVALDLGVDTTTPTGRLVANVMMSVAEWEREVIAARTRDALAERRAAGVRLGRERVVDSAVVARIMCDTAEGWQPGAIARRLDADGIATPAGGRRWYVSTVSRIIEAERRIPQTA